MASASSGTRSASGGASSRGASSRKERSGISSEHKISEHEPHIGKYRFHKTIGKGNFAKVKLAKHLPTGREVFNFLKNIYQLVFNFIELILNSLSRLLLKLLTGRS